MNEQMIREREQIQKMMESSTVEVVDRETLIITALEDIFGALSESAYEPSEMGAGFAFDDDSVEEAEKILRQLIKEVCHGN